MIFYTNPPNCQTTDEALNAAGGDAEYGDNPDWLAKEDWPAWQSFLKQSLEWEAKDKTPEDAGYECFSIMLRRFINSKGYRPIIERARAMTEHISQNAGSYADAWRALNKTFPALLNGTDGVYIDSDTLGIVKTFEEHQRLKRSGRAFFRKPTPCLNAPQFAKQHANWIRVASEELGLPFNYVDDRIRTALNAANFAHNQTLSNVRESLINPPPGTTD